MKNLLLLLIIVLCGCGTDSNNIRTWPDGEVYYKFSTEISPEHKTKVESIFNTIEDNTKCIYFVRSIRPDAVLIGYSDETGVSRATLGYNRVNTMNIVPGMFNRHIYHETLHVLGLRHEHQRPDRDNYITVLYENIIDEFKQYFDISEHLYDTDTIPYDCKSIMHYSPRSFTVAGQSMLFLKGGYVLSKQPTELDYAKVIDIYRG